MRAYVYDDLPGDQRLPHDSGKAVGLEELKALGVHYWRIQIERDNWLEQVDQIARERDYKNRDQINVSREGFGDAYESKIKTFFEEHMHEDEEIRFIQDGSGFFDVRDVAGTTWIRIAMQPGDLIVLPAGIYHRFTLDEKDYIKAMRLFKDEPKWVPHNRSSATDENPFRKEYLASVAPSTNGASAPSTPQGLLIKRLSPDAHLPTRGSALAAGYDLYSAEHKIIPARGKALVDTKLSIAVPPGTYGRVAPRSGLASKHMIDTGAGVIDADYRGVVFVLLFNHAEKDFEVNKGDRIAQLILERIVTPEVVEVEDLDATVRGAGGFGSTGGFGIVKTAAATPNGAVDAVKVTETTR